MSRREFKHFELFEVRDGKIVKELAMSALLSWTAESTTERIYPIKVGAANTMITPISSSGPIPNMFTAFWCLMQPDRYGVWTEGRCG